MSSVLQTVVGCALLAVSASAVARNGPTLYDRIGGESKMRATVHEFVLIMESDDRINFTFANTDLKKFEQLLFEQLCNITDGGCKYTGRDMYTSHAKLNITNAMFNALAEDLYAAFDREHVPTDCRTRWSRCWPRCSGMS